MASDRDNPERYRPDPVSDVASLAEVIAYLRTEHERIALSLDAKVPRRIQFLTAPPNKLFEGLTVGANGTNWNPGAGKGVYTYYSGVWNKLG